MSNDETDKADKLTKAIANAAARWQTQSLESIKNLTEQERKDIEASARKVLEPCQECGKQATCYCGRGQK